ncbi:MAG TPA: c-type cytochrome [Burkholderiaceae bacterium]|nr:c-type cytochrome [Burkholderiaceae bacterium]
MNLTSGKGVSALVTQKNTFYLLALACTYLTIGVVRAEMVSGGEGSSDRSRSIQQVEKGQRIYREGKDGAGQPLMAFAAAQTPLSGSAVACAACHRRSGYGTSEGQFNIRPITGPALFQEQTLPVRSPRIKAQLGTRLRPPYTEALLARAIRTGIDSSGKPLDPVMPRYPMNDDDVKSVSAYLATLSANPSPGVDDEEIHFATVIQPGVSTEKRRAMLDIMEALFRDKGANVRSDEQRRDAGNMRMYRAYRKWILHVWDLKGSSETWKSQLEKYYAQQPVFALVGGLGETSWKPIHEFAESAEIPSLFPQVNLPLLTGENNYNFYFTRGITLEAEVVAKFLRDRGELTNIVQVYRPESAGQAAASSFQKALPSGTVAKEVVLTGPADEVFWNTVSSLKPESLVLWLGASDLEKAALLGNPNAKPVYVSFSQMGERLTLGAIPSGTNVRMIYPSDLPPKHASRMLRTKIWLHEKNIPIVNETIQINTQFALIVLSDAIGHMQDSFSRDYLVERVEHVVSLTPTPSIFPTVSLGPGQRIAARGASIVQFGENDRTPIKAISGWIVP